MGVRPAADRKFRKWLDGERKPRTWSPFATYWPSGEYPDRPRYQGATDGAVDIGMWVDTSRWGFAVVDIPTLEILGRKLERRRD